MHLVPRELEKLATIFSLGYLAQRRLARGVRLNHAEAIALISTVLHELIRDGHYAVADLMSIGRTILGRRQVLPSTWFTARQIQVEGTFPTGTYLVTVVDPIATENGDMQRALYGSCIKVPKIDLFPVLNTIDYARDYAPDKAPGYIWCIDDPSTGISLCHKRDRIKLKVVNHGNRPIQVGSHYHFIETNRMLSFNRKLAQGYRLDLPAGSAMRFEPGQCRETDLVFIAGAQRIAGGNGIATGIVGQKKVTIPDGFLDDTTTGVLKNKRDERVMERSEYVKMFGPTTGDVVRLGSTELYVAVEYDYRDPDNDYRNPNGTQRKDPNWPKRKTYYGDECNFGGGKSIRDGMAQTSYGAYDPSPFATGGSTLHECVDTVITNALIIDHTGIIKADIGIKDGHIQAIGRAGNPDIMDDVDINIGANTDVIGAENKIVTAGGIDTHVHVLDPAQVPEALCNGLTTLVGGGAGPTTASNATTVTTGPVNIERMMKAFDHLPINVGLTGKGNNSHPAGLVEQIKAGAIGLKLHEDWGATHVAIDKCLEVCDDYDVQSTLHTDTMNECGYVGDTENSIKNRTIHSYHTEGAGGGHAPDIIAVVKNEHILPASTNPTRPYTFNTTDEHLDMVMVAHHLSKEIPADVAFAESRIHAETMAAEDCLLDDGSISIMSSDTQAMGRVGEVVLRTWTSANKMAVGAQTSNLRDALAENQLKEDKKLQEFLTAVHPKPSKLSNPGIPQLPKPPLPIVNNFRVKRYIAKYTINPALAHGMSHLIGSVEKGKFADLVIWQPSNFGTKPDLVLKGGMIAVALGGDPNGSIPTIEPKIMRPRFATYVPQTSITFVSKISVCPDGTTLPRKPNKRDIGDPPTSVDANSKIAKYKLKKRVEHVQGCRVVKKTHMIHNDTMPANIKVDPETFVVSNNGIPYDAPPATSVPLAQDYFVC